MNEETYRIKNYELMLQREIRAWDDSRRDWDQKLYQRIFWAITAGIAAGVLFTNLAGAL